jgi:hypothetical protein
MNAPTNAALSRQAPYEQANSLQGDYGGDARRLTETLAKARESFNCITPATTAGDVPDGWSCVLTAVAVDPNPDHGEVYKTDGGKLALGKIALLRIARACGVSFAPHLSRRVDDGKDPMRVTWSVVAIVRAFDGTTTAQPATKELDLRKGSPQVEGLTEKRLAGMRKNICSLAETEAMLRAIRAVGIAHSYTEAQLAKPFLVAGLMRTGRTDDPILRRRLAEMAYENSMRAETALYGMPQEAPPMLAAAPDSEVNALPPRAAAGPALPPARETPPSGRTIDMPVDTPQPTAQTKTGVPYDARTGEVAEPATKTETAPAAQVPVVTFGKAKGERLTDISDRQLSWYAETLADNVEDPAKANWRQKNQRDLDDALKELSRRKAAGNAGDDLPT